MNYVNVNDTETSGQANQHCEQVDKQINKAVQHEPSKENVCDFDPRFDQNPTRLPEEFNGTV